MANNREIIAREIVDRFTDAISGTDKKQFTFYSPEDRIYVGKLSPQSASDAFSSSVLIKQISVNFRIPKSSMEKAILHIIPKGFFFYRVIPTLEQQREFFLKDFCATFEQDKYTSFEELLNDYNSGVLSVEMASHKVQLLPVYERISIQKYAHDLSLPIASIYDESVQCGSSSTNSAFCKAISDSVDSLCEAVKAQEGIIPCQFRDKTCFDDLANQDNWENYKKKQIGREEFEMYPRFDYGIAVEIKENAGCLDITVAFSNETQFGDESAGFGQKAAKNDKYRINTLFNSGIEVKCENTELIPIELDYFANDYKYDKKVYAIGNNCNVEYDLNEMSVWTVHVPVFIQKRLVTNNRLSVKFADLISSPVQTLSHIHQLMLKEALEWKNDLESRDGLTEIGKRQFQNEITNFEMEIKRFKTGIDLIEQYNMIRDAFVLMNTAFKRSAKGYDSWRLFQIVFVVSLILDIVAHEPDLMLDDDLKNKAKTDDVDILYFPTGGGKTEAFLGILVFNLFFDRIRGKECGLTALLKYPLRLLSVQQVQRVSNILATAEILRVERDLGGQRFSLGYFVGEGNTPNKIDKDLKKTLAELSPDEIDAKYRLLDICPFCGRQTVRVCYNETSNSLVHSCNNENCPSKGLLPLYMVDEDIYRRIPSVIISTVDKMTAIGLNSRFHNLIYGAEFECPDHGFSAKKKCLEYDCKHDPSDMRHVSMKDPAPTLLIQDELHLIKESLGTYDAHYETLIEYFVKKLSGSNRGIKVIGATATISAYEIQAKHLYWKNAIRFPAASPYLTHNFYSKIDEDDIGRIIIGYAPFGKAIVNSVAYSVQYLKRVVYELYRNPEELIKNSELSLPEDHDSKIAEIRKLLQDYWMILEYNNVKQESNRVLQALEDPINTELIADGIQPLIAKKMTGDDSFQEVRATLSSIEHASNIIEDIDFNMIAATSMISHGVDADRFNLMLFYGMPGNTAEYIQAYSRVGRKHTGVVIDIMRPSREKDQRYLRHFAKFHEFKDILVDSVSINRWATKAVENTLPGVVSSLLLNHYLYKLQFTDGAEDISKYKCLKYAVQNKLISLDEIKSHVLGVYKCSDDDNPVGRLYKAKIEKMLQEMFDGFASSSCDGSSYLTQVFNHLHFHVMESLRDTDKQIIVELK